MSKVDYFSVIEPLINDKQDELGDKFVINQNKLNLLKNLCKSVGVLERDMDFESFECQFNDKTGRVDFKIITGFFSLPSNHKDFSNLINNAIEFIVSTAEKGETVELFFAFDNIWDYL